MFNKKCTVEYDGSFFSGWQLQNNSNTIQAEIMKALKKIYKVPINITGAGRTDAGVHAKGQVFNFYAPYFIDNRGLLFGLNSLLPTTIAITKIEDTTLDFHARFSAKKKVYLYKVFNSQVKSAFYLSKTWWVKKKIDVNALVSLMNIFVGEFDFAPFCQDREEYSNTLRKVFHISVFKNDPIINIELCANGFLRKMVRFIVGTAIKSVISNDIKLKSYNEISKKIKLLAPPEGLYLKEVIY